jgi:16S rRNA (adenine1518-N6/adenine1519-N6)-dimethyltransferase
VRVHRAVSRTVFHPVPNVDSVLVVLRRTGPAASPELRALVQAAFAHRRKALARSLALAPGAPPGVRDRARAAVERLGHPPDVRAERLSPTDFAGLAEALKPPPTPQQGAQPPGGETPWA